MAKDKPFHKKQQRKANSFERAIEWRKSNEVVLIVCEGEKTEPNYLKGLHFSGMDGGEVTSSHIRPH